MVMWCPGRDSNPHSQKEPVITVGIADWAPVVTSSVTRRLYWYVTSHECEKKLGSIVAVGADIRAEKAEGTNE